MTPTTPAIFTPGRDHQPRLDAIRGIAIIMVLLFHAFMFDPTTSGGRIFSSFITSLSQGTLLFFVLSGFLISLIIVGNPDGFSVSNYLVRRCARIIPPFALSLAFFAVKEYRGTSLWQGFQLALANLATLPNFLFYFKSLNPVGWFLFIEIHFYLLLPLVFFLWRKATRRHAELLTIGSFLLIPFAFRTVNWMIAAGSTSERFFLVNRFPSAMDFFSWGMLFCYVYRHGQEQAWLRQIAPVLASRGLLLLLPVFLAVYTVLPFVFHTDLVLNNWGSYEIARLFICLIAFCLLFCIWPPAKSGGLAGKIFDSRLLQYAGLVSYEWFLFHAGIIPSVRFHLGKLLSLDYNIYSQSVITFGDALSYALLNLIAICVSFFISAAIYRFYSQPLLKWMRGRGQKNKSTA
jgi:peptidoglycan/LPS O-acetylase OafA/YrhL